MNPTSNHDQFSATAELYLLNRLSEADREAQEEHYFGCTSCLRELQALRLARTHLQTASPARSPLRWMLPLAAAFLAAGFFAYRPAVTEAPSPVVDYALLAVVKPPAYDAPLLRGSQTAAQARFAEAMEPYKAGDYSQASRLLKAVVEVDPKSSAGQFYLGAAYLLLGQPEQATGAFEALLALGDTPFASEARFLLAQAYLKQNNAERARAELVRLASGDAEFSGEARQLIEEMNRLGK